MDILGRGAEVAPGPQGQDLPDSQGTSHKPKFHLRTVFMRRPPHNLQPAWIQILDKHHALHPPGSLTGRVRANRTPRGAKGDHKARNSAGGRRKILLLFLKPDTESG